MTADRKWSVFKEEIKYHKKKDLCFLRMKNLKSTTRIVVTDVSFFSIAPWYHCFVSRSNVFLMAYQQLCVLQSKSHTHTHTHKHTHTHIYIYIYILLMSVNNLSRTKFVNELLALICLYTFRLFPIFHSNTNISIQYYLISLAQSAGVVEYTNCFSAEG